MKLQVAELVNGQNYSYDVTPFTTIAELKQRVNFETGIPESVINFRVKGVELGGNDECTLLDRISALNDDHKMNLLIPPKTKEFTTERGHVDLEMVYKLEGGCLAVYRWRCHFCFICEFDIANGCTECGICSNKMASRCKDDGCEVDCCCEGCQYHCCQGKCSIM